MATATTTEAPQRGTMKALGLTGVTSFTAVTTRSGGGKMASASKPLPDDFDTMLVTVSRTNNGTFNMFHNEAGERVGSGGVASKLWAVPESGA
jgi:hypothetical protein